jgi:sulfur carrier protein
MEKRIRIIANGETFEIADGCSLPEFLEQSGWKPHLVVVEYNGQATTRTQAAAVRLQEGDRLEVVRIVAGG